MRLQGGRIARLYIGMAQTMPFAFQPALAYDCAVNQSHLYSNQGLGILEILVATLESGLTYTSQESCCLGLWGPAVIMT